ncbi:MAG: glucose-6-phosphate dehydrogenase [Propionibacteriaceae bacterium]|nr:glucose-6-phosphate dehydrogenase [Propionibacteriaceae bacterium]
MEQIQTLVILGASGDLTSRLLLPGLATYLTGNPERRVQVVGSSREDHPDWAALVRDAFDEAGASGPAAEHAVETTRWVTADATSGEDLAALLAEVESPACLYFALPPAITQEAVAALAKMDLSDDLALALEKPVGTDLETAREINRLVARVVPEERTFRVDHFPGMPGVLSFIGLRFANRLLAPLWSSEHVESIAITFDETLGLEGRASFYDSTGALRDMFQSHLLQVMALVMMDPPSRFDPVEVPAGAAHVLRNTRLWGDDPARSVVRGRYTAGTVDGEELPDYVAEEGVDPGNETETFFQVRLEVDSWRWGGVPVTLRSGKAIGSPRQEIAITLKRPPHEYDALSTNLPPNTLTMGFEDEHLQVALNVGGPFDSRGRSRVTVSSSMPEAGLTAYGSVIRWILEGDPTFTVRGDAVEEGWRITEDVLAAWADQPLRDYPAGSSGPV